MADKIVQVPGLGNVSFPSSMSDDEISSQISKQMSLKPSGTAPSAPATPNEPSLASMMGMGSNVASMASSGAGLGSMLGPVGTAVGAGVGALGGLMLPPSESPGTDMGTTAADLLASRFLPGGLNTGRRLARIAGTVVATGTGAFLGSQGDKAMGFQKDTPWGKIGIYSALATPGAILGSLASEASPVSQAADRLQQSTGVQIPLSTSEQTGRFSGLEKMLTAGSSASTSLGMAQDAAATSAFNKIVGAPLEKSLDVVMRGQELEGEVRKGIVKPWVNAWKQGNATTQTTQTVTGGAGFAGNPTTTSVTKTVLPKNVDWGDFQAFFGLTAEEKDGFFRAIKADPQAFISQLIPSGENQTRGLLKLRGLMAVLDKSGKTTESGQLGQAVVMRALQGPMQSGEAVNGKVLAARITNALGSDTEPGMLTVALGKDRANALRDLATVLDKADPLEKVATTGVSAQKRAAQYLTNKAIFTAASGGAMALAGSQVPGATLLVGMTGGAIVGIGLPTILGAMMAQPRLGKFLIAASKGDLAAGTRLVRTLGSSVESAKDRGEDFELASPASRLQGLFK